MLFHYDPAFCQHKFYDPDMLGVNHPRKEQCALIVIFLSFSEVCKVLCLGTLFTLAFICTLSLISHKIVTKHFYLLSKVIHKSNK